MELLTESRLKELLEAEAERNRLRARVAALENAIADANIVLDAAIGDLVPEAGVRTVEGWREVARELRADLGRHFPAAERARPLIGAAPQSRPVAP